MVFWRLRYKLSLRDLPEMFLIRGIEFSYEAGRDWEAKLTPSLIDSLRRRRKGRIGRSWYIDETYIKVNGRWCYLYRAIDRSGALVDVRLSERRDMAAAKAFFRSAKVVTGVVPARVTTDGHDSGSGVEIFGLVFAAFAMRAVRTMDLVGTVEFRSVQSDQDVPVKAAHRIQAAALVQLATISANMGWNMAGSIASSFARIWLSPGILRMPNSVWQFERPWPVSRCR